MRGGLLFRIEMSPASDRPLTLTRTLWNWWQDQRTRTSLPQTAWLFGRAIWEFARDSTPSRERQRFGDADFDWDFRVDTTSARVGWRELLLGEFHSLYQPTEPGPFQEMMSRLNINFRDFTFIDIGSGKGRVLLMASNYPFKRIIGLELLPALHAIAQQNLAKYKSATQQCFQIEPVCCNVCDFELPLGPMLLYFFHPLSEPDLRRFLDHLKSSLEQYPRIFYVVYHNPVFDFIFQEAGISRKVLVADQYAIYSNAH